MTQVIFLMTLSDLRCPFLDDPGWPLRRWPWWPRVTYGDPLQKSGFVFHPGKVNVNIPPLGGGVKRGHFPKTLLSAHCLRLGDRSNPGIWWISLYHFFPFSWRLHVNSWTKTVANTVFSWWNRIGLKGKAPLLRISFPSNLSNQVQIPTRIRYRVYEWQNKLWLTLKKWTIQNLSDKTYLGRLNLTKKWNLGFWRGRSAPNKF